MWAGGLRFTKPEQLQIHWQWEAMRERCGPLCRRSARPATARCQRSRHQAGRLRCILRLAAARRRGQKTDSLSRTIELCDRRGGLTNELAVAAGCDVRSVHLIMTHMAGLLATGNQRTTICVFCE